MPSPGGGVGVKVGGGVGVDVNVGVRVGVFVEVGVDVTVGVSVEVFVEVGVEEFVGVGVKVGEVGPNNCPGPQPELNKLINIAEIRKKFLFGNLFIDGLSCYSWITFPIQGVADP